MHRIRALLVAATLAACGDKGDDTTTASETSASTGADTSGPPTTGGSATGGECEPPPVDPLGAAVAIDLVNMRAEPVFIDATLGCEPVSGYQIFPAGSDTKLDLDPDCRFDCATIVSGMNCECALGCPAGQVRRIDPGVTFTTAWNGGQLVTADLGEGCGQGVCTDSCIVPAGVPAGMYALRVPASTTTDCETDCECPQGEACLVFANRGADDADAELVFDYPAQTKLTLTFE